MVLRHLRALDGAAGLGVIHPFRITVGEDVLTDLRARLNRARLPDPGPRGGAEDGLPTELLASLVARWRDGFDWRVREAELNALPHFTASIDGLRLHWVRLGPERPGAHPVLLLHGWPGTFVQMLPLAERLSGAAEVVIPSLPGFGFSGRPVEPGWTVDRMARAMHRLMTEALGHARYAVHGSDFGLSIALRLGRLFPDAVSAVHVSGTHLPPPEEAPDDLRPDERAFVAEARRWYACEAAYNEMQATKPQTLGAALNDSPTGLLAWIAEKHQTWSVPDALFSVFSQDDLLTTATIYWATETITSSARLYREERLVPTPMDPSLVPVHVSQPALEEYRVPEAWWRRLQPVASYALLPGAAHFPEWEAPDALSDRLGAILPTGAA